MLCVIMLSVIMLSVIMLSVDMLNVIILSVIMLSVIMLNVIMPNVVMPSVADSMKSTYYPSCRRNTSPKKKLFFLLKATQVMMKMLKIAKNTGNSF